MASDCFTAHIFSMEMLQDWDFYNKTCTSLQKCNVIGQKLDILICIPPITPEVEAHLMHRCSRAVSTNSSLLDSMYSMALHRWIFYFPHFEFQKPSNFSHMGSDVHWVSSIWWESLKFQEGFFLMPEGNLDTSGIYRTEASLVRLLSQLFLMNISTTCLTKYCLHNSHNLQLT